MAFATASIWVSPNRGPTSANLHTAKAALVVIDLQRGFMMEGIAHALCPAAPEIEPNVNHLAEAVRAGGGGERSAADPCLPGLSLPGLSLPDGMERSSREASTIVCQSFPHQVTSLREYWPGENGFGFSRSHHTPGAPTARNRTSLAPHLQPGCRSAQSRHWQRRFQPGLPRQLWSGRRTSDPHRISGRSPPRV